MVGASNAAPQDVPEYADMVASGEIELADWNGEHDVENPFKWSKKYKVMVTAIAIFATLTTQMNGTIISVAHEAINEEFGITDTATWANSYWPITSWALGGAVFSMLVLPLMEDFGIRKIFLMTYLIFEIFLLPQGLSQSFVALAVTRFFAGGCVSILANTSASIVANVWEGAEGRSIPLSLWVAAYLCGTSIGPVIGAAIFSHLSWRWISYCQLIWLTALFPLYYMGIPETRASAILKRRAQHIRATTERRVFAREELVKIPILQTLTASVKRPLYMLFTEPVVFVFTLWIAFSIGCIYLFTQSVEQVFVGLYGWSAVQAGYVQAATVVGVILGWPASMVSKNLYLASAERNLEVPGMPIPEARLYVSAIGGILLSSGGMFIYAWSAYNFLPWIAPAVSLAIVGAGNMTILLGGCDYLTDTYSRYAGSALAAVSLGENVFAAFLPLAAPALYINLGYHWASTLLALCTLVLSFAPVVLLWYGPAIRARSPFMRDATYEKKTE